MERLVESMQQQIDSNNNNNNNNNDNMRMKINAYTREELIDKMMQENEDDL